MPSRPEIPGTAGDLEADARTAWLFAQPIMQMARVRARLLSGLGGRGGRARANAFAHARALGGPGRTAVTTPNVDTIYSTGFLDLTAGPVRLEVPDAGHRYLSVTLFNMWTDADIVLGPRTPGGASGAWRLIGPGSATEGARDIRLGTPHAWAMARILVDGAEDLPAARRCQDGLVLSGPDVPSPRAPAGPDACWPDYFRDAASLLLSDPPPFRAGLDAFERVRAAGRSGDFRAEDCDPTDAEAIGRGVEEAAALVRNARSATRFVEGWTRPSAKLGQFGDDILLRATVSVGGLGALPAAEAMYFRPEGDEGTLFLGDGLRRLRLAEPVPVDAFWSLTMYEAQPDGSLVLARNPLDRYAIGDRTAGLVRSPDGTTEIWIARTDPGGVRSANWLPAPARGPYTVVLRAYLPQPPLREGRYRLPRIETMERLFG